MCVTLICVSQAPRPFYTSVRTHAASAANQLCRSMIPSPCRRLCNQTHPLRSPCAHPLHVAPGRCMPMYAHTILRPIKLRIGTFINRMQPLLSGILKKPSYAGGQLYALQRVVFHKDGGGESRRGRPAYRRPVDRELKTTDQGDLMYIDPGETTGCSEDLDITQRQVSSTTIALDNHRSFH